MTGHKLVFFSTRGPDWYQRAILSVEGVGQGGEMPTLHDIVDRMAPRLPGMQGVRFDGAP